MKFKISKTSDYGDNKPCDEAVKEFHQKWHTRSCSEDYFNTHFSEREGLWRSKGKNHTTESNGHITRQEQDIEVWVIEINDLKRLMRFIDKYGDVIVSGESYAVKLPEIEIYDAYRE